jgi:DNA polymerase-3 subunit delta
MAFKNKENTGLADLKQQLKTKQTQKVYLFYGPEKFLLEYYLKELKAMVLNPDTQDFNLTFFENKVKPRQIIDACETYPVFTEKKMVIVRDSGFFKASSSYLSEENGSAENEDIDEEVSTNAGQAGNENSGFEKTGTGKKNSGDSGSEQNKDKEEWKTFFESLPPYTILVFIEESVNRTLSLYKQIAKAGMAVEFALQEASYLNRWICGGFSKLGKKVNASVADYLIHIAEEDMTAIYQEIHKVASYMGSRTEVTCVDLDAVVIPSVRSRVFDLMDSLAGGNSSAALQLLDDMIRKREPEQKIFYMMTKQSGKMLLIKRVSSGRLSSEAIASRLAMNPYSFKKLEKAAGKIPIASLEAFVRTSMEMDLAVKSGRIKIRLAMELLIAKL